MGFKVPELTASSKAPLAEGAWDMEIKNFTSGESSVKKTPYVQVVFKVTEEDAVDTDGEPFTRNFYGDKFYMTGPAMWRLKKFASAAGVEIPESGEEYESVGEYAKALTDAFSGLEATVDVVHRRYRTKEQDEDTPESEWEGVVAEVSEEEDEGYHF